MAIGGYYRFNGDATDASGNANNGTLEGGTTPVYVSQVNDGALELKGDSTHTSRVNLGTGATLGGTNWTIAGLFNISSLATTPFIIMRMGASYNNALNYYMQLYTSGGNGAIQIGFHNGGWRYADSAAGAFVINKQTHLVGTFDGTYLRIYKNGVLLVTSSSLAGQTPPTSSQTAYIGNVYNTSYNPAGIVDDVKIDNTAWSNAAVRNEYSRLKGFF